MFHVLAGLFLGTDECRPFALRPATQVIATYRAFLTGWSAGGGSWDSVACPQHAAAGFQWLSFEGNVTQARSDGLFEPVAGGAVRVLRSGTVSGAVRVHWSGRTSSWSKYLIVGESTLEPGVLPSPHDTCLLPASACGACLDGFTFADCGCDAGATEVTFSHVVEAGQLLQVAAIPAQFEGAVGLAGEFFVSFSPGGFCDFAADGAAAGSTSEGCTSPWDGVWLGGAGCSVERARQSLDAEEHALELATQGCFLTEGDNTAPFFYRAVGTAGDFTAVVQVRDSSNVQWSGGGLLLTPARDGATEWVALRIVQARHVVLEAARGGVLQEAQLASTAGAPEPWLQLERRGGALHARWRAAEGQAWEELVGSPLEHGALRGGVRVGLTHQTFSRNVGAVTLASFALEGGDDAGAAADEQPALANQAAWTVDSCIGPALALDEVNDHVLLPRATLCAADALLAAPPPADAAAAAAAAPAPAAAAAAPAAASTMVLRLWWRTSELQGQWYLPGRFGEFEEWLFAHGMPGAAGSLNVYLLEGSEVLRTRVCAEDADAADAADADADATAAAAAARAACEGDALDVAPGRDGTALSFADDHWHMYVLAIRCDGTPAAPGCTARVFLDGALRASSAVGAPAGALAGAPAGGGGGAARPVVGARADLDALRFYGGLLARVALGAGAAPTEDGVRAEWAAFWAGSPCAEPYPAPAAAGAWSLWATAALLGVLAAAALLAAGRRRLRARAHALLGDVPLLGLRRAPPSHSTEHVHNGRVLSPSRLRAGPGSFSAKLSSTSCEISCNGGGAREHSPGPSARVLSPRAAPPVPLQGRPAGGGAPGRSFQTSSSSNFVTIEGQ